MQELYAAVVEIRKEGRPFIVLLDNGNDKVGTRFRLDRNTCPLFTHSHMLLALIDNEGCEEIVWGPHWVIL